MKADDGPSGRLNEEGGGCASTVMWMLMYSVWPFTVLVGYLGVFCLLARFSMIFSFPERSLVK